MKKIFTINCGSTSTKIAYFEDLNMLYKDSLDISVEDLKTMPNVLDQLDYRTNQVKVFIDKNSLNVEDFDIIVARAGTIPHVPKDGAYEVNDLMVATLKYAPEAQHASTLSSLIAVELAKGKEIPVIVYDSTATDMADPIAKVTGIPEIVNMPIAHLLNTKMAGMTYAKSQNKDYKDLNLIIAHLGGGITLGFHDHGRIADWIYDDEGPMSPQRAGRIPTRYMVDYCYNSKLTQKEMKMKLAGKLGLAAYFGTQDIRDVEKMIEEGNEEAKLVYEAMAYGVAKGIGELSVVRGGNVDCIILTGGIANSKMFTDFIIDRVKFIAPVSVIPGEKEMEALAAGGYRVLNGEEEINPYNVYPKGYTSIEEIINNPNYLS